MSCPDHANACCAEWCASCKTDAEVDASAREIARLQASWDEVARQRNELAAEAVGLRDRISALRMALSQALSLPHPPYYNPSNAGHLWHRKPHERPCVGCDMEDALGGATPTVVWVPEVWVIVDVPRMDCSDRETWGPYASKEAAIAELLDPGTALARGRTEGTADVRMIEGGRSREYIVFLDATGKRKCEPRE